LLLIHHCSGCKDHNYSYQGSDIKEVAAVDEQLCKDLCNSEPDCLFWTWSEMKCHLQYFGALQNRTQKQKAVSGTANCPGKSILICLPFQCISALVKINKSALFVITVLLLLKESVRLKVLFFSFSKCNFFHKKVFVCYSPCTFTFRMFSTRNRN
jgi:hypothetical protein